MAPSAVRAYRMLLRLPTASIGELAVGLNMSMMDVRSALTGLEDNGLVGRLPGAPGRFRAEPPERALGPLVRRRNHELRAIRADVDALHDEFRGGRSGRRDARSSVDLVTGTKNLRTRTDHLIANATTEVCVIATGPTEFTVPSAVPVRAVYPAGAMHRSSTRSEIGKQMRTGTTVRTIGRLPVDIVLVDRSMALLPVHSAEIGRWNPTAVVVWPGGLHDTLVALFDSTWAAATPLRLDGSGEVQEDGTAEIPTPEDLTLLRLLLDGLTDQAIAGRLGVGERTVQRRVRDLIDLVSCQTRLQLIWQATQRGWI